MKNDALVELAKKESNELAEQVEKLEKEAKELTGRARGLNARAYQLRDRLAVLNCLIFRKPMEKTDYAMGNTD